MATFFYYFTEASQRKRSLVISFFEEFFKFANRAGFFETYFEFLSANLIFLVKFVLLLSQFLSGLKRKIWKFAKTLSFLLEF